MGLRRAFQRVFYLLQRGKVLEDFTWWSGHYLLSVDGTGYFMSDKVHCEHCCEKRHRDGRVSYYHQLLGAALVPPQRRSVLPLAPEPIRRQDGTSKNDCERNAAKRLLTDLRREHPHLKLIIENETFNTLKNQGYHFEHNFGHGYQHLSTVFAYLMLLAFLLDNVHALLSPKHGRPGT